MASKSGELLAVARTCGRANPHGWDSHLVTKTNLFFISSKKSCMSADSLRSPTTFRVCLERGTSRIRTRGSKPWTEAACTMSAFLPGAHTIASCGWSWRQHSANHDLPALPSVSTANAILRWSIGPSRMSAACCCQGRRGWVSSSTLGLWSIACSVASRRCREKALEWCLQRERGSVMPPSMASLTASRSVRLPC